MSTKLKDQIDRLLLSDFGGRTIHELHETLGGERDLIRAAMMELLTECRAFGLSEHRADSRVFVAFPGRDRAAESSLRQSDLFDKVIG